MSNGPALDRGESKPVVNPTDRLTSTLAFLIGGGLIVAILAGTIGGAMLILCVGSKASDIAHYQQLKQILDDVRAERSKPVPYFASIQARADQVGRQVTSELRKAASKDKPAQQFLLWAARDELPRMMRGNLSAESPAELSFAERLQNAATELGVDVK